MFGRREQVDEYREFAREILLRLDRTARELEADNRRQEKQLRAQREESRKYFEALHAQTERRAAEATRRLDELLEESRAQRSALMHMLDRLDNGGTAPAG